MPSGVEALPGGHEALRGLLGEPGATSRDALTTTASGGVGGEVLDRGLVPLDARGVGRVGLRGRRERAARTDERAHLPVLLPRQRLEGREELLHVGVADEGDPALRLALGADRHALLEHGVVGHRGAPGAVVRPVVLQPRDRRLHRRGGVAVDDVVGRQRPGIQGQARRGGRGRRGRPARPPRPPRPPTTRRARPAPGPGQPPRAPAPAPGPAARATPRAAAPRGGGGWRSRGPPTPRRPPARRPAPRSGARRAPGTRRAPASATGRAGS